MNERTALKAAPFACARREGGFASLFEMENEPVTVRPAVRQEIEHKLLDRAGVLAARRGAASQALARFLKAVTRPRIAALPAGCLLHGFCLIQTREDLCRRLGQDDLGSRIQA